MIYFPHNPVVGQQYVGINAVTYTWMGDRWSGAEAIQQGLAVYYVDGGDAEFNYNAGSDGVIDGGTA